MSLQHMVVYVLLLFNAQKIMPACYDNVILLGECSNMLMSKTTI